MNDSLLLGLAICGPAVLLVGGLAVLVRTLSPRCPACRSRDFRCVDMRRGDPDAVYHYACGACGKRYREPPTGGRQPMSDGEWAREVGPAPPT